MSSSFKIAGSQVLIFDTGPLWELVLYSAVHNLGFGRLKAGVCLYFSSDAFLRRAFEQFVDERLIGFGLLRRKSPQLLEKPRVDANGNELLGVAASRPANAPRAPELFVRQFRNI